MQHMDVPRPPGNGRCSDDSCPCGVPGAAIPRGLGYLYISKEVADFRRDCPTDADVEKKFSSSGYLVIGGAGVFFPILMCELGAKSRGLNLAVAAADARHWWATGTAPIRATPLAGETTGETAVDRSGSCYVVTATYGMGSRPARLVHLRCRQRFLLNPLLMPGWCIYKYYGPLLAQWSKSSPLGFRLCKALLADPILHASSRSVGVSALWMLYLTMLSVVGLLLLLPSIAVRLLLRLSD